MAWKGVFLVTLRNVEIWEHKILQQSSFHKCVLNYYECTELGRNIIGDVCPNNVTVTRFCACLCRNEDSLNYVCCNIVGITHSLLQPFLSDISKSTKVIYLLLSRNLS